MLSIFFKLEIPIIVIISILLAVSSMIATNRGLLDYRSKGIRRVKKRDWYLVGVNMGIGILLIGQQLINDYEEKYKEQNNKIYQDKRDSILKARYDS